MLMHEIGSLLLIAAHGIIALHHVIEMLINK